MKRREFLAAAAALGAGVLTAEKVSGEARRLNVLWIVAEDASPHLGCYGETGIKTPNLDILAREGVRFEKAFISCPVCSPARSALVTGMYQTTIGSHNHRSQRLDLKGGGNTAYYESYNLPESVPLVGDLFRDAGYYVCNGAGVAADRPGKTDYNFITDHEPYDGNDWRDAPEGTPFFAQIQLSGGKSRRRDSRVEGVALPPYYPEDPVLRDDWAEYLGSWERMDEEVGHIVQSLKDAGVYEETLVVFLTDHGVSHARGKQFLYEEGIRVPMIIRFPGQRYAGMVRDDLASHIDLVPTSLAQAGIAIPEHLQGLDLFGAAYSERDFVVSARDRCDETLDTIRCIRTPRYKYIRNFQSYRSHMQHNQYKDGKEIVQRLRQLHANDQLTPFQARIFAARRPPEELYDLSEDPHESRNLAEDPGHINLLAQFREDLYAWMLETRDPGLFPEPILEDLGRVHGSKHSALHEVGEEQIPALIRTIEAGERGDLEALNAALKSSFPAQRYWAATWLGNLGATAAESLLETACQDDTPAVRVAAHLALCKLGSAERHLPELVPLIDDPNQIVGMYAMDAIDQTGILNDTVRRAAEKALMSPYDSTQRYGKRLMDRM